MCPERTDHPAPTVTELPRGLANFSRCEWCSSPNHSTENHAVLERIYQRERQWLNGFREMTSHGPDGGPSPSILTDLVTPDRLRLVPFTIGTDGWEADSSRGAATLRLWKPGPSAELTCMLSFGCLTEGEVESLARLCGDHGSVPSVAMRFGRSNRGAALPSIARST